MKAAIIAYATLWILLIAAIAYSEHANARDCDQFAAQSKAAMSQKLNGKSLPGHDDLLTNEMHANTSAWALHKNTRHPDDIIQAFADEWQHACMAGWYPTDSSQ